jgi:hypothetical protein
MTPLCIEDANGLIEDKDGPNLFVRSQGAWRVSRWSPTAKELRILNSGGSTELWVRCGNKHPAVRIQVAERVESTFDDEATRAAR